MAQDTKPKRTIQELRDDLKKNGWGKTDQFRLDLLVDCLDLPDLKSDLWYFLNQIDVPGYGQDENPNKPRKKALIDLAMQSPHKQKILILLSEMTPDCTEIIVDKLDAKDKALIKTCLSARSWFVETKSDIALLKALHSKDPNLFQEFHPYDSFFRKHHGMWLSGGLIASPGLSVLFFSLGFWEVGLP